MSHGVTIPRRLFISLIHFVEAELCGDSGEAQSPVVLRDSWSSGAVVLVTLVMPDI